MIKMFCYPILVLFFQFFNRKKKIIAAFKNRINKGHSKYLT